MQGSDTMKTMAELGTLCIFKDLKQINMFLKYFLVV